MPPNHRRYRKTLIKVYLKQPMTKYIFFPIYSSRTQEKAGNVIRNTCDTTNHAQTINNKIKISKCMTSA